MDEKTLRYYNANAGQISQRYLQAKGGISEYFLEAFPFPGGKILDIGCGAGRDLAILLELGYEAFGLEPSEGLRRQAIAAFPNLESRIFPFGIPFGIPFGAPFGAPLPERDFGQPFDGIVCSAVFMHLSGSLQEPAAAGMKKLLRPSGRVLLSVPDARPGLSAGFRDEGGRLFQPLPEGELTRIFSRAGFLKIKHWCAEDSLGRPGHSWITLLFVS